MIPDEKGVESLARQIKMTGRAYPLFDIAQLILQKPERHAVVLSIRKNAEGKPVQPLFLCALDDTVWLSEDEAVAHVLRKHFATFYQAERTATEPPKGKYTFVAQCGLSGVILGPPNYHNYQNELHKLHAERFSRMPFEMYKARVKIVREEEVVKKWIDDQSWRTEYVCLNVPEPLKLANMEAVEKHFRETHKESIIKPVESHKLTGTAARALRSSELVRLTRSVWEDQRRFPLQIATVLSQQFAGHGLQFFKVNKTITHVSVARPHYLDLAATPVSEGVRKIVEFIEAHPKCSRRKLIEALTPSPTPPVANRGASASPSNSNAGETPAETGGTPASPATEAPASNDPTPEQAAMIGDLHWLVHQGDVIEFANGSLDTAKRPVPKPSRPEPKPAEKPAEPAPQTEAAAAPETAAPEPMAEAALAVAEDPLANGADPAEEIPFSSAEPTDPPAVNPGTPPLPAGELPIEPATTAPAEPQG